MAAKRKLLPFRARPDRVTPKATSLKLPAEREALLDAVRARARSLGYSVEGLADAIDTAMLVAIEADPATWERAQRRAAQTTEGGERR